MTYVAETRADTAKTKRIMRTSEMRTVKTIAGKSLMDRVRNSELQKQINSISDIVR